MSEHQQLTLENIKRTPTTYAVYVLKHQPTGRVFIASTNNLRSKLRWWYYVIRKRQPQSKLPVAIFEVLLSTEHGRFPAHWTFSVVDMSRPASHKPLAWGEDRPEWPLIMRLYETQPHLVLNTIDRRKAPRQRVQTTMGQQPVTYLGNKLGYGRQNEVLADVMQPHSFRLDMRKLQPACAYTVPFAMYLYRACLMMQPRDKHPSPAAIAELYATWLERVPMSERETVGNKVPYTIDDALNVPTPRGYDLT